MLPMKTIPNEERPREKGIRHGVQSLSDRELLAILIRSGTKEKSALEIADEVLILSGGIKGLENQSVESLCTIPGISSTKAIEIKAALELKTRSVYSELKDENIIDAPETLANYLRFKIGHKQQEEFVAVYLDSKGRLLNYRTVFKGTVNQSLVSPREIFSDALKYNATNLIVAHNHPSGSLQPSRQDKETTRRLLECGKLMNVELLDHLIITDHGYTSLRASGLWEVLRN